MRDLAYVRQEDATPCVKLLFLFKGMICIYTGNKDLALEISDVILLPFTLDIPHTFIPFISFALSLSPSRTLSQLVPLSCKHTPPSLFSFLNTFARTCRLLSKGQNDTQ